ncbi:hypothetical protein [Xylanimonas ulmi]|uniref:Uncharacterized protein n=1 Tax=Xylanimonas ulmi TaxID=228973 RepID=A0A4Q7M2J9_9MICO|nr:hypothetical protein [Xylanibacterium ulmi]RZS61694.1 hypothetical protein EV386_2004 [Xylanibacterium ulmi]
MSTFGRPAAAAVAPLIVSRHQDNDIILRWRQRDPDTGVETPVDLTGWTVTVTLSSPQGQEWTSWRALTDVGGVVHIGPTVTLLSDPVWASRPTGTYRVVAVSGGRTVVLADDQIRIV